jgi:cytochrome oxidase Cu insertion factor (SCO1/SenC/PrrC family)
MKSRFKVELALLALVCFGPVVAAYLLFYYGDLNSLPRARNEERLLMSPAVPLPPVDGVAGNDAWGPKWSLVYARTATCDDVCRGHLVRLQQVHHALGRDLGRVQRVYLGPDGAAFRGLDASLRAAPIDIPSGEALVEVLAAAGAPPAPDGRVYVVDPHGNLVLSYPPDAEQEGLLDDLERLLDLSRIG